jgi:hypothetical protein
MPAAFGVIVTGTGAGSGSKCGSRSAYHAKSFPDDDVLPEFAVVFEGPTEGDGESDGDAESEGDGEAEGDALALGEAPGSTIAVSRGPQPTRAEAAVANNATSTGRRTRADLRTGGITARMLYASPGNPMPRLRS